VVFSQSLNQIWFQNDLGFVLSQGLIPFTADFKPVEFDGFKKQAGLNCESEQHAEREKKRLNGFIEKNLGKVKVNG